MAHFTDVGAAVQQGEIGDTIEGRRIHWGYGTGDYTIVWIAESRRTALVQNGTAFQFIEASGYVVLDSFIGPQWTVGSVLQAAGAEYAIAAGAAMADEHERAR